MKKNKNLIKKSNKLIESHYKLNLNEQKFVLKTISLIKKNDENFKEYEIKVSEFQNLLGLKSEKRLYGELKKVSKQILKKPITISEPDGDLQCNWFSSIKYINEKGIVVVSHDPKLKPYLIQVKKHFTMYKLENVLKLKSIYSIRIYELLSKNKNREVKDIIYTIDDLKFILGIDTDKYQRYNHFKERVLEISKKEICSETEFNFQYKALKTGKKVTSIKFIININKSVSEKQQISLSENILQILPTQYHNNSILIQNIATAVQKKGEVFVISNIKYANSNSKHNYPLFLKKALKDDGWAQEKSKNSIIEIKPGMILEISGQRYIVDDSKCIFPKSGGCVPEGTIRNMIKNNTIKIVVDKNNN